MLEIGKVHVSALFWLFLAAVYFFDNEGLLLYMLSACAVHETGHCLMLRAVGGRLESLTFTLFFANMKIAPYPVISYLREAAVCAAGPAANFLASAAAALVAAVSKNPGLLDGLYLFIGANVLLGVFNLLPAAPLDGGQIVYFLLLRFLPMDTARTVRLVLTAVTATAAVCFGVFVFVFSRRNFSLLIAACFMLLFLGDEIRALGAGKRAIKAG